MMQIFKVIPIIALSLFASLYLNNGYAQAQSVSLSIYIVKPKQLNCRNEFELKACRSFESGEEIDTFLNKLTTDRANSAPIKIKTKIRSSRFGKNGSFFRRVIDYGVVNFKGKKKHVRAALMVFDAGPGGFKSGHFSRVDETNTYSSVSKNIRHGLERYVYYGDLETLYHQLGVQFSISNGGQTYSFSFVR